MIDEHKLFNALDRIAIALEAIAGNETPAKPAQPTLTEADLKARTRKSVSVIRR